MGNELLQPVPLATPEFWAHMREIMKDVFESALSKQESEKLVSPSEACKIFQPNISKVTLNNWTVAGRLVKYKIGGRIYYRLSEVIAAAKVVKRYSSTQNGHILK